MHTTSQLPDDLQEIKYHLGFPLVKFEAPISLGKHIGQIADVLTQLCNKRIIINFLHDTLHNMTWVASNKLAIHKCDNPI